MSIQKRLKIYMTNRKWRKINTHNTTNMRNYFDISRVKVGKFSYGELYVLMHNSKRTVTIGNFCSIAPGVVFIPESDHNLRLISTFPFKVKCLGESGEAISKGDIVVEDDVWIGYGAVILSGVHIGQGAVIGAGSIINKDVPPYAVVCGNPTKIIKYRFSEKIVKELLAFDYSGLSKDIIIKNINLLYGTITDENVGEILKVLQQNVEDRG